MIKKARNEVVVGTFVILGFIMLTLIVFFISGVYLFRPGYSVNVLYQYVSILDKGAPVRMSGVRVGEVSKVDLFFDAELKRIRVKVKLFIEKGVQIRENYTFNVQGTHVLSEPHIEITPVTGDAPLLKSGTTVEGVDAIAIEDLITKGHQITDDLAAMTAEFRKTFGKEETVKQLEEMINNLTDLTRSMDTALDGSEENIRQSIVSTQALTGSLNQILEKVENGEGTVGQLLMKDELYQELRAFVAEIKAHPWKLLKKDGGKKFLWLF